VTQLHQLERTLRTLKLGGMLGTLDQRLAQARAGELGHLEFLEVLCEDEIARRQAGALRRRIRRAHSVALAKTARLLAELAGGHADRIWGDDFLELVSERHKTGSMVLTSNRAPPDWYGLFPNPVVAEGVLDLT
jgi:DNA replication protein DnaC